MLSVMAPLSLMVWARNAIAGGELAADPRSRNNAGTPPDSETTYRASERKER